jgi:hypothetical protein
MITITIENKDGTFIAKTNNPEIAEMELDRLVREYFSCEDCALEDECAERCYYPEKECCDDIEERREHQRNVINKYIENK